MRNLKIGITTTRMVKTYKKKLEYHYNYSDNIAIKEY
jgi:hypothetical protein